LEEGVRHLQAAWRGGLRDPDVAWALLETCYSLGRQADATEVAADYIEASPDPNEKLRAAAFGAMSLEVRGDYEKAVSFFHSALVEAGEHADPKVQLESYLNGHVAAAYGRTGRSLEWMDSAFRLWEAIRAADRSWEMGEQLLMSAGMAAHRESGARQGEAISKAIGFGESLLKAAVEDSGADSLTRLTREGRTECHLLWLYHVRGHQEGTARALRGAKDAAAKLVAGSEEAGADRDRWRGAAFTVLHNAGLVCRGFGEKHEALPLLRQAEQVATRPFGPTFYALAALVLETGGDKRESLHYLRRIAEDRGRAYGGLCVRPQETFASDPAFREVRDDPAFIAVIRWLREATSTDP